MKKLTNTLKCITLSSDDRFPFGDSVEHFLNTYFVNEDIEYYKIFFQPRDIKTLERKNYKAKIIFINNCDSFISYDPFDYYKNDVPDVMIRINKICEKHPDKKFILLPNFCKLNHLCKADNLFSCDNFFDIRFNEKYIETKKKKSSKSNWIYLNNETWSHRVALVSYIIAQDLDKECILTTYSDFQTAASTFYLRDSFRFNDDKRKMMKIGLLKLASGRYRRCIISADEKNNIKNYNKFLSKYYSVSFLEIVSGTLFFDPTPFYGEKEIQNIYGKNFPIYINAKGAVKNISESWNIDVFEDVVDHSYDVIEDPTDRLLASIDLNKHLLDGSVDLKKLWHKHEERFNENCKKIDRLLYDVNFQREYNTQKLKNALDFFNIDYSKIE